MGGLSNTKVSTKYQETDISWFFLYEMRLFERGKVYFEAAAMHITKHQVEC